MKTKIQIILSLYREGKIEADDAEILLMDSTCCNLGSSFNSKKYKQYYNHEPLDITKLINDKY